MRQLIRINKMVIYFVLGIILIIFRKHLVDYLYVVVGIPMLVLALEGLCFEIYFKKYLEETNHVGAEILRVILSIIIIFFLDNDVVLICIIWGIIAITNSVNELNESIYKLIRLKNFHYLFKLLEAILQIVFAILLIISPKEHVLFHLLLLGIEFELEASRIFISIMFNLNLKRRYKLEKIS